MGTWLVLAWALIGADPAIIPHQATAALADAIDPLVADHRGQVAVFVRHLRLDVEYVHRPDEPMPTASLIKLPVMIAAYQQAAESGLDLGKMITFREADKTPGSGILSTQFSSGLQLSLRDAVRLMIAYSDNSATNMVLREVGLNAVNQRLAAWDCPQTRIHAYVFIPESSIAPEESKRWGLGKTTARESAQLLIKLHRRELVNPAACEAMLEHLFACDDTKRLGAQLPAGTKIALKTGSVSAARTVAGLVESPSGPFVVTVLTAENVDRRWADDNAAEILSAAITKAAWDVFHPDPKLSPVAPADGRLTLGSQGLLVEDLQRTLNTKREGLAPITVDGDFGPQTVGALKAFQRQVSLPDTGTTDEATWAALGPLVLAPKEQPSSATPLPNESVLRPADPLDGPPIVTCKAWAIGDPATGELRHHHEGDVPRDFASTTKIMTAYLALRLAESRPDLLTRRVTFSLHAATTPGSSAMLRPGESATVEELLYGLMLPSGNDAAAVLAEFLGTELPSGAADCAAVSAMEATPELRFIAEMNRTAAALGMSHTKYANPHGLTHADHKSTPRDQCRLAAAALQLPTFRTIVSTRERTGVLHGPGGYQRPVLWTNTNRLLGQEGFSGVKTGTTQAAGACLVSYGERDGRGAIVVVFGATSSDARYLHTRNLFRWHWSRP